MSFVETAISTAMLSAVPPAAATAEPTTLSTLMSESVVPAMSAAATETLTFWLVPRFSVVPSGSVTTVLTV